MTAHGVAAGSGRPPAPDELRLITADQPLTLAEHGQLYGPLPAASAGPGALIAEVERSGLTGRGGGAFPAGRKLRAVAEAGLPSGAVRGAAGGLTQGELDETIRDLAGTDRLDTETRRYRCHQREFR